MVRVTFNKQTLLKKKYKLVNFISQVIYITEFERIWKTYIFPHWGFAATCHIPTTTRRLHSFLNQRTFTSGTSTMEWRSIMIWLRELIEFGGRGHSERDG